MQLKFKMLTLKQIVSQIRSEDWFVMIDLKDAYFHISIHPCHRKFLRFAFGGKAYQYWVLDMGLNLDAGAPVTDTYIVHPVGCGKNKARPVTHCQTVSETVRSYGISIQRDTFWIVAHETPAVVAQDQRVFREGQPLLHDEGHAAMPSYLGNVEETLFLSQGPVLGASCRRMMLTTDASLTGWGAILEGRSSQSLWKNHHLSWHVNLSGDVGCISCFH